MGYDYETEKLAVTDDLLLEIVFAARRLLQLSGAATMEKLIRGTGSNWTRMAAVAVEV